jgi:transposase-like protein
MGREVDVPRLPCPECERPLVFWSGYWRWVRAERDLRIWVRRGRCPVCKRSQALLPSFLLERRLDAVPVIGQAVAESVAGRGLRKVAEERGRPHSTVRDWRRRHRARAAELVVELAQLAADLGAEVPRLAGDLERAALAVLAAAWTAARGLAGMARVGLWTFTALVTGGRWLATTTVPP